jgi:hypothetical protein
MIAIFNIKSHIQMSPIKNTKNERLQINPQEPQVTVIPATSAARRESFLEAIEKIPAKPE